MEIEVYQNFQNKTNKMKKLIPILATLFAIILLATSCKKEITPKEIQKPDEVTFNFQQTDRDIAYSNPEKTAKASKNYSSQSATANQPFVIYVSMKGENVNNPQWNNGLPFTVSMADTNIIKQAIETTKKMYSMFENVVVTTDVSVWQSAGVDRRVKIIVGNSSALGPYLGYAWVNCYLWQDDTPAFVLVNNCNQTQLLADIGYGITHEAGHMFGLEHQYASGGSGFKSWATLMGNWASKNFITWSNNDIIALRAIFGSTDDYVNSVSQWINNPSNVGKPFSGFITFDDPADVCRMKGSVTGTTNITITCGGGWPILINVYNKNKVLKQTGNTLQVMSKTFTIPKGNDNWYIEVKNYSGGAFPANTGSTTFSSTVVQQ